MSALPSDVERLALIGWHLYPVSRHSKAGAFEGAAEAATFDLDILASWTRDYPGCAWRVVCGPSGLFALDVDRPGTHKHDGFATLAGLVEQHGSLPPRPMTRTGGSGGAALFFRHRGERLRGSPFAAAPGLDPHRGRQAIVVPPSHHPITGGAYSWRVAPWDVAPPALPAWVADLFAPPPEPEAPKVPRVSTTDRAWRRLHRALDTISGAAPGTANSTLNRESFAVARHVAAGTLGEVDALESLYAAARARRVPHREARDTIKSGFTSGLRCPAEAVNAR